MYLLVFFILNTSLGPQVLHGQLSNFLHGDFYADTMRTDPFLITLTMTNVALYEPGKTGKDYVVFASKIEAKIPLLELTELSNNTLKIGRIKVYDADVVLDFSKGKLNILNVVLPYESKPEPPTPPGDFVVWLADLNTDKADVHLIFDGFRIDLNKVDVDHYSIRTSPVLMMDTPVWHEGMPKPIRVQTGTVAFNPAMFSFALSDIGDKNEGLIFSGGSGTAGKMGYGYTQMARHLENMLRTDEQWLEKLGAEPDRRGQFVVPLRNTFVEGFFWKNNRFDIPRMDTEVGANGTLMMEHAFMNVGPTQEEMDEMERDYELRLTGTLPQETILWDASIDLDLPAEDPILTYFFGPILKGGNNVHLLAALGGDLGRVTGDLSLDTKGLETFGVGVNSLTCPYGRSGFSGAGTSGKYVVGKRTRGRSLRDF